MDLLLNKGDKKRGICNKNGAPQPTKTAPKGKKNVGVLMRPPAAPAVGNSGQTALRTDNTSDRSSTATWIAERRLSGKVTTHDNYDDRICGSASTSVTEDPLGVSNILRGKMPGADREYTAPTFEGFDTPKSDVERNLGAVNHMVRQDSKRTNTTCSGEDEDETDTMSILNRLEESDHSTDRDTAIQVQAQIFCEDLCQGEHRNLPIATLTNKVKDQLCTAGGLSFEEEKRVESFIRSYILRNRVRRGNEVLGPTNLDDLGTSDKPSAITGKPQRTANVKDSAKRKRDGKPSPPGGIVQEVKFRAVEDPPPRLSAHESVTPNDVSPQEGILKDILKRIRDSEDLRGSIAHKTQGRVSGQLKAHFRIIEDDINMLLAINSVHHVEDGGGLIERANSKVLQSNAVLRKKIEVLEKEMADLKKERLNLKKSSADLQKRLELAPHTMHSVSGAKAQTNSNKAADVGDTLGLHGFPLEEIATAVARILRNNDKNWSYSDAVRGEDRVPQMANPLPTRVKQLRQQAKRADSFVSSEDISESDGQTSVQDWQTVRRRRQRKIGNPQNQILSKGVPSTVNVTEGTGVLQGDKSVGVSGGRTRRRNLASTAALRIVSDDPAAKPYEKAMATAKGKIDLADLGIDSMKVRAAWTGGLLLTIPSKDNGADKIKALAEKMRGVLPAGYTIACPMNTAVIKVTGLDPSVSRDELTAELARLGDVAVQEIAVKAFNNSGMSSMAIVHLPSDLAGSFISASRVRVGWSSARIQEMEKRPLRCFKCWKAGHVRARCPNEMDLSENCYTCGQRGHTAGECKEKACVICDRSHPPHKAGAEGCKVLTQGSCTLADVRRKDSTSSPEAMQVEVVADVIREASDTNSDNA